MRTLPNSLNVFGTIGAIGAAGALGTAASAEPKGDRLASGTTLAAARQTVKCLRVETPLIKGPPSVPEVAASRE
jgi:hypothetical protein